MLWSGGEGCFVRLKVGLMIGRVALRLEAGTVPVRAATRIAQRPTQPTLACQQNEAVQPHTIVIVTRFCGGVTKTILRSICTIYIWLEA
jgi:hypothetical protein